MSALFRATSASPIGHTRSRSHFARLSLTPVAPLDDIRERWEVEADFRILPTMQTSLEVATLSNRAAARATRRLEPRARRLVPSVASRKGAPTAIARPELLSDAAREAKSLQLLHRFGWLIGKRLKGVSGKSKLGDRNVTALEREPAEPPHRGTLVAIGIAVSQQQADAQRVVKGDLWKLTGRGEAEVGVAGLERAPEASVWTAGVTHPERMFAPWSS
jgi:hypothetical protein